jgi:hypothetical protein
LGVLLNHTTTTTGGLLPTSSWEEHLLDATHLSLHFTRMGFMFITGLVLFLQHYHKELHVWSFWKKRYLGVGIPFVSWAMILLASDMAMSGTLSWQAYWPKLGYLVTHGTDYYLYYIIVTFQLYLVFPALIWLFKRFAQHHWHILFVSFVVQILMLVFIKYGLPHVSTTHWPFLLKNYGFSLLVYQFYFVLGAFASIHYDAFKRFIIQNHRFIGWTTLILAIGTVGEYYYNQSILGLTLKKSLEIHQPYIFIYDLFIIGFVVWLGLLYADYRENGLPQWFVRFVGTGAKIGFGMYLGQTVALWIAGDLMKMLHLPSLLNLVLIPLVFLFVIAIDYALNWIFLKVPPFGFLIGRPQWRISRLWRQKSSS